jgi:phospholipid N-methyltransferase
MSFSFWRESVRTWRTSGAVAPSSEFLARAMVHAIRSHAPKVVVELGPGDGAITKHILEAMPQDSRLISLEINDAFCNALQQKFGHDPRFHLVQDSAEQLESILAQVGLAQADIIVSSIPFVVLPDAVRDNILAACKNILTPGGYFMQFHYSLLLRQHYRRFFSEVGVKFVALNIPPAFVFTCRK